MKDVDFQEPNLGKKRSGRSPEGGSGEELVIQVRKQKKRAPKTGQDVS